MPKLWAEEVLQERGSSLGAEAIYRLTLMATGDRRKADEARCDYIEKELREERTPKL